MKQMYINKVFLTGQVSSDIDIHYIDYKKPIARFTLEVTETIGYDDNSFVSQSWHHIVAYNDVAKVVEKLVKQGAKLTLSGRLTYRKYTKKTNEVIKMTEIRLDDFSLLEDNEEQQKQTIENEITNEDWIFDAEKYSSLSDEPPI